MTQLKLLGRFSLSQASHTREGKLLPTNLTLFDQSFIQTNYTFDQIVNDICSVYIFNDILAVFFAICVILTFCDILTPCDIFCHLFYWVWGSLVLLKFLVILDIKKVLGHELFFCCLTPRRLLCMHHKKY